MHCCSGRPPLDGPRRGRLNSQGRTRLKPSTPQTATLASEALTMTGSPPSSPPQSPRTTATAIQGHQAPQDQTVQVGELTLHPCDGVGGAQKKFTSPEQPEKFYKTGPLDEAEKAAFFNLKLAAYTGEKTHFNGPPETKALDLTSHKSDANSPLHTASNKGLSLLEMDNLTHNASFASVTGSIDIKIFPAYDTKEFKANRGHRKKKRERVQLAAEEKFGFKFQDGGKFQKLFGAYKSSGAMENFFNTLAEEAALEEEDLTRTASIQKQLIDDFLIAVSQAKSFIEATDFIPLGMSLMPVVTKTDDPDKPYQLSLNAIDPDHLMAKEGDSSAGSNIYLTSDTNLTQKKNKMTENLQKLYNFVEQSNLASD